MKLAVLATDNREHDSAYSDPAPRFCTGVQSLLTGFASIPDLEVHLVSCSKKPMAAPEKLAPNIYYHCLVVPQFGWLRTLYQGCIRATRRKLREINPDLVHGMGLERDACISAVLSGIPCVVSIHGNMAETARLAKARIGSYLWLTARLENFTLPRAIGVFCNSAYTEALARPRSKKTWRVAHALRPYFLDPPPNLNPRPCSLLVAGVIQPRKRQLELLDVAEELHRRGLKFEMRFIGIIYDRTDPYVTAFLKRIKPMEAAGYAKFLGTPTDAELVSHFDAVSGMIHFPTEEAFGNVVCESLARGLKFFGSKVGGIADIAGDVPGAELFDLNDWKGLTDAIARWIGNGHPLLPDAPGLMRSRFHHDVIARRHLEIYRESLNTRA
ncbi:MAG TPA: glycosyltransferase family 4 protein [Verrucomicrobiota bacterium]|nr:glycosyltransferase family 4 protein [Verrucomicrobiota bacterium]